MKQNNHNPAASPKAQRPDPGHNGHRLLTPEGVAVRLEPEKVNPVAPPAFDRLLTVGQLAELLQLPVSWVYERTRRRGQEQLPHLKLGKYLRFEEHAVREFLERQRRN